MSTFRFNKLFYTFSSVDSESLVAQWLVSLAFKSQALNSIKCACFQPSKTAPLSQYDPDFEWDVKLLMWVFHWS